MNCDYIIRRSHPFAKTQSTHSQRLTAVIVSENVVSTLPGQSTPAADLEGLGSRSYSKATTENNPNKHGTSRKTVASVRPRVVSNPREGRISWKVVSIDHRPVMRSITAHSVISGSVLKK